MSRRDGQAFLFSSTLIFSSPLNPGTTIPLSCRCCDIIVETGSLHRGISLFSGSSVFMSSPFNNGTGSGSALDPAILRVAAASTTVATLVSAISIFMHLKNYRKPLLQRWVDPCSYVLRMVSKEDTRLGGGRWSAATLEYFSRFQAACMQVSGLYRVQTRRSSTTWKFSIERGVSY